MENEIASVQCGAPRDWSLQGLLFGAGVAVACACALQVRADDLIGQGSPGEPYPNKPSIALIGERIGKYIDVPASAVGPAIDPTKGYRLEDFGNGLYMVTDNVYQSLFLVYSRGVVVIDAPPIYAARIPAAIAEITSEPITHLVYSHSHADHIGGAKTLGGNPVIIAHEETKRLLVRVADPNRPVPTVTFSDRYTLRAENQVLELSYHGNGHEPGNIFIHAPEQRVLMVVDVVFPGWMPWRRFALAQDIPGYFAQVDEIQKLDWDTLVAGHVGRTGVHADVELQAEFNRDIKQAAADALASTEVGVGLNPLDNGNAWALFDDYIDRVAARTVSCRSSCTCIVPPCSRKRRMGKRSTATFPSGRS